MRRFFVRFRVETLASIASRSEQQQKGPRPLWRVNWTVAETDLILYDALRRDGDALVHEGLALDMHAPGDRPAVAIGRAQNLAEGLVNLIAYTTGAACKPAELVSWYEIEPAGTDVRFTFRPHPAPRLLGDLRPVDQEELELVYRAYDASDADRQWAVSRAAQGLRKGDLDLVTVDRFTAYWSGLEALAPMLAALLLRKIAQVVPTCSECGTQLPNCPSCDSPLGRPDNMAGVGELYAQSIPGGKKAYQSARSHRGQLLHGGKHLTPAFLEELKADVPAMRKALALGIGRVLGLPKADAERFSDAQLRRSVRPISFTIEGTLEHFTAPALDDPGAQPTLDHEPQFTYKVAEDGKLTVGIEHTLTMHNASFRPHAHEVHGDELSRARQAEAADEASAAQRAS